MNMFGCLKTCNEYPYWPLSSVKSESLESVFIKLSLTMLLFSWRIATYIVSMVISRPCKWCTKTTSHIRNEVLPTNYTVLTLLPQSYQQSFSRLIRAWFHFSSKPTHNASGHCQEGSLGSIFLYNLQRFRKLILCIVVVSGLKGHALTYIWVERHLPLLRA